MSHKLATPRISHYGNSFYIKHVRYVSFYVTILRKETLSYQNKFFINLKVNFQQTISRRTMIVIDEYTAIHISWCICKYLYVYNATASVGRYIHWQIFLLFFVFVVMSVFIIHLCDYKLKKDTNKNIQPKPIFKHPTTSYIHITTFKNKFLYKGWSDPNLERS